MISLFPEFSHQHSNTVDEDDLDDDLDRGDVVTVTVIIEREL